MFLHILAATFALMSRHNNDKSMRQGIAVSSGAYIQTFSEKLDITSTTGLC